jgi:S-formylglutathione hydrolase FrmB
MNVKGYLLSSLMVASFSASTAQAAGSVQKLEAPSPTLGRSIAYLAYLPAEKPVDGQRWPVFYLLHGRGGTEAEWFDSGGLATRLDKAIAEGRIQPMVVITPGAGNSWYVDGPEQRNHIETAFSGDLVKAIDTTFPTAACREGRAIGGSSMGGWGAVLLSLDHPNLYLAAISLSGAMPRPMTVDDLKTLPLNEAPYQGAFGNPFDIERFNKSNVFNHIDHLKGVSNKPGFWFHVGDGEEASFIEGAALMHDRLREEGAISNLRIDKGGHNFLTWRRSVMQALEWLSPRLVTKCSPD